ncbi:MAG TPA: hypothetical protein VGJ20_33010 [Xanthobacteraceae bacterium]|jgi:hypothetical protein
MAVAAIAQCLKRYGKETLVTALQCVTQTANNRPGMLSARMIKALCGVLDQDRERRDSGLALFEAFDTIDLTALQNAASVDAAVKKIAPAQALAVHIQSELDRLLAQKATAQSDHPADVGRSMKGRSLLAFRNKPSAKEARRRGALV